MEEDSPNAGEGVFLLLSEVYLLTMPVVQASIEEYMTMVAAGLAGATPHMISATVTAISRLVFEFKGSSTSR